MELNFVFFAREDVRLYLDLAKNEKRQNCLGFDVQGSFTIPPSAQKRCHLPLHKGGTNRFVLFYMAWFSLFYRQSKTPAFDRGEKIFDRGNNHSFSLSDCVASPQHEEQSPSRSGGKNCSTGKSMP